MRLIENIWTTVTYAASFLTLSPIDAPAAQDQAPLLVPDDSVHPENLEGPIFKPPSGRPGADFECDYSGMPGWRPCSTPDNRGCWLKNDKTGEEYNISTVYERFAPVGIKRKYSLDLASGSVNADGLNFKEGKIFNGQYPGPWIQACWGDTIEIIVNNKLKTNGTSIHWHGIRQNRTIYMDGVNGISQCPIAPGDKFNYTWKVIQYGSSWYHSHYSVQYSDGAVGPMTLHGPSSAPYDEPKQPILLTDWGHNSAFQAVWTGILDRPSTLLNGVGNVTRFNNSVKTDSPIPAPYTLRFDPPPQPPARPKRYLLRIINTSFESTFVFSIDNHYLQIVGADFVPIHPYKNTSVLVGIGQRYHVIVEAAPQPGPSLPGPTPNDQNFWIRAWRAACFRFPAGDPGYEKAGILRYSESTKPPTSEPWPDISLRCSDETYSSLKPIVPWTIGPPSNDQSGKTGEEFTVQALTDPTIFPLARFSMGGNDFNPLQIDYSNPTFLNLNYTGKWPPLWVVFPENYTDTDWVYMVLKGVPGVNTGAHPLHLHGHDFAILQQIENANFSNQLNLNLNNPPRRDVVLLPTDGYVVIAFKTDNPGAWIFHCHIAFHASYGLALQVLERQKAAAEIFPSVTQSAAIRQVQDGCNSWNKWWGDCQNWWPGDGSSCPFGKNEFSPDSGI